MPLRCEIVLMRFVIVIAISSLLLACEPKEKVAFIAPVDPSFCQFQQDDCQRKVADIDVTLHLSRPAAPSETPFDFTLSTSKMINHVTMKLEGRDMYMGKIPVSLSSREGQQFSGTMMYGSCSSGYMVWNAIVSFDYLGQHRSVVFPILADNDIINK